MTRALRILSAVSFTAALAGAPAKCAGPPFSFSISLPQEVVKSGSEVRVKIVLRNTTDHELRFVHDVGGPFLYRGSVVDGSGNAATYTEFGRRTWGQNLGPFDFSGFPFIEIAEAPQTCVSGNRYSASKPPTQRCGPFCTSADIELANRDCGLLREELVISQLYDLTKPGKYTIQLERYDAESKTTIKSNTISVMIVP